MTYTISEIMNAWRDAAVAEWEWGVRDDDGGIAGDREIITSYFEAVGWGWHIPGGYVERADNPWCGIGQAFCGLRVGHHLEDGRCVGVMLDPDIAEYILPSTRRLEDPRGKWWRKTGFDRPEPWTPEDGLAALEELLEHPQIGTVCTRDYGDDRNEFGGHVVLIEQMKGELILTIEFNGRGHLGDGSWGEGVVRRSRPVSQLRRVWPLEEIHFEQLLRDAA